MAVRRWVGRQGAVAQIDTLTPAGVSVGSTFTVTINNKSVTFTATAATVANVTAGLVAALGASLYPEFAEVTWADGATAITATGPDTGAPFTATVAAGGTGSPTFGTATTTSPTGPNWWGVAANWKEGSAPATGDDVTIDEGPSILYGLDQSAVTLASLTVTPNFPQASEIGLPRNTSPQNPDQGYPEYRPQRLKIGVTVATVDTVSGRVRLDLDTDASTVTVDGTGTAVAPGEWPLDLVGVNTATAVRVNRGTVGLAANAGDAMTVGTLKVAYRTQRDGDAVVELGVGLTVGTSVEQSGGAVTLRTAVPTYTKEGGTLLREGSGALTTMLNHRPDPGRDVPADRPGRPDGHRLHPARRVGHPRPARGGRLDQPGAAVRMLAVRRGGRRHPAAGGGLLRLRPAPQADRCQHLRYPWPTSATPGSPASPGSSPARTPAGTGRGRARPRWSSRTSGTRGCRRRAPWRWGTG
jgi:hypothetical protein